MRRITALSFLLSSLCLLAGLAWCRPAESGASPPPPRSFALVSGLGSAAVTVVDPARPRVVRVVPVDDARDVAEIAPAARSNRHYVLDQQTRLRVLGPRSQMAYATWILPRTPLPPEEPVLTLSGDERWLFVRSGQPVRMRGVAASVWARDLRGSSWVPVCLPAGTPIPPRVVAGATGACYSVDARGASELRFDGTAFVPTPPVRLPLATLADATVGADGRTLFAVGRADMPVVAPTGRPRPERARARTSLATWRPHPGIPHAPPRVVDVEKWLTPSERASARPLLAASKDGQWLVVIRDRSALFLRPDTLALEDRVWLDGSALAATFTLDSRDLLVLLEQGRLVRLRAGDRYPSPVADGLLQRDAGARLVVAPAAW